MIATADISSPSHTTQPAPNRQFISWIVGQRVRITSIAFVVLIAECVVTGFRPHNLLNLGDAHSLLGLGLVLTGLALRSWAAGILHKSSSLTTIGPYSIIRNPLYVGSFLMMVGFFTLISRPEIWMILSPFLLLFIYTVKKEECLLAERFGQSWNDYVQSTPRFIPRRLTSAIAGNWNLRQWKGNREYQAVSAAGLGLIALQAWQMI
jgi:protein-S-isoprenylcysteine O-methyltransferase Ste14